MQYFYGTFGSAHLCGMGCDKYVEIYAEDIKEAERIMNTQFGSKYCMVYYTKEEAGIEQFELTPINIYGRPLTKENVGLHD